MTVYYVWVHVPINDHEKHIKTIITDLNNWFSNEIAPYLLPKLMSIICKHFEKSSKFFAESLCEYQGKHGK